MSSLINGIKSVCTSLYNQSAPDKAKGLLVTAVAGAVYLGASGLASDFFENAVPYSSLAIGASCAMAAHVSSRMNLPSKVCLGMGMAAASAGIVPSMPLIGSLAFGGVLTGVVSSLRGSSVTQSIMNGLHCTAAATSFLMGASPVLATALKAGTIFTVSALAGLTAGSAVDLQINPRTEGPLAARHMTHPLSTIAGLAAGVGAALTVSPGVAVGLTAAAVTAVLAAGELFLEHAPEEHYVQIPAGHIALYDFHPEEIGEDGVDVFDGLPAAPHPLILHQINEFEAPVVNHHAEAGG